MTSNENSMISFTSGVHRNIYGYITDYDILKYHTITLTHKGGTTRGDEILNIDEIRDCILMYNLIEYMDSKLANVKGHNYFKGSGIPKRFL